MFSTNVKALTFVCFSRCRFFLRPLLPSGFHFVKMWEPMLCLFLSNAGFFSKAFNIDIIIKNILSFFCSLVKGLFQNNRGGGVLLNNFFTMLLERSPCFFWFQVVPRTLSRTLLTFYIPGFCIIRNGKGEIREWGASCKP